jgi:branched-chain amino acid transport system substrate-binding protein
MASHKMTGLRRWLLRVLLGAAVIGIAACGSDNNKSTAQSTVSGSGSGGGGAKTLTLGMVWSMSGPYAPYGQPGVDGVNLAISDINKAGGVKVGGTTYKLKLKVVDDRSDAQAAVAGATGLLRDDHVQYLLGPLADLTGPVAKLAAAQHVLQLSAATIASPLAGTADYPLLLGTVLPPTARCQAIAKSITTFAPSAHKVALVGPNNESGQLNFPICEAQFKAAGLAPQSFRYPAGSKDLTVTMTKVAAAKPDVISTGWAASDVADILPAVTAAGIPNTVPIVLFGASYDAGKQGLKDGRPFVAIPFVVSDFTVPSPTQQAIAFRDRVRAFLKTQNLDPLETSTEFFYDAVRHLALAMQDAGTVTDTAAVAKSMNSITSPGITGDTRFVKNIIQVGVDATFVQGDKTTTEHIVPASAG